MVGEAETGSLSSGGPCGHRPLGEDTYVPHGGELPTARSASTPASTGERPQEGEGNAAPPQSLPALSRRRGLSCWFLCTPAL